MKRRWLRALAAGGAALVACTQTDARDASPSPARDAVADSPADVARGEAATERDVADDGATDRAAATAGDAPHDVDAVADVSADAGLDADATADAGLDSADDGATDAARWSAPDRVDVPALDRLDWRDLPLPRTEAGTYVLVETPEGRFELDPDAPRSPLTALGDCTDLIVYCVRPPARSLDECATSVPVCRTERPWEEDAPCCPAACVAAYASARAAGRPPLEAFEDTYPPGPPCFPGVRALVAGDAGR